MTLGMQLLFADGCYLVFQAHKPSRLASCACKLFIQLNFDLHLDCYAVIHEEAFVRCQGIRERHELSEAPVHLLRGEAMLCVCTTSKDGWILFHTIA